MSKNLPKSDKLKPKKPNTKKQAKTPKKKAQPKKQQKTTKKQNKKSFLKSIFMSVFMIVLVVVCALFCIKDESITTTATSKTITDKNIQDKNIKKLKQEIQKQKQEKQDIFSKINANSNKTLADIKPSKKQFYKQQIKKVSTLDDGNEKSNLSKTNINTKQAKFEEKITKEVSVLDDGNEKSNLSKTNINTKQAKFEEKITKEVSVLDDESIKTMQHKKPNVKLVKPSQTQANINTKQTKFNKSTPYLTIIIDDVANIAHVNSIKSTNLPITPSIFPPSSYHPNTPKLAKKFDVFMVHLPMEALYFSKEEKHTLKVGDTYDKIYQILSGIKKDFKGLKFYNNHTGSKFTSDYESMRKLLEISDSLGLVFLDSKTIANSKAKDIRKAQNRFYFVRDVFLDNQDNEEYIKSQLQAAIKLAYKKGYAIAIGHPRINTINAIKNTDFSSVNIIKIDKMYDFLRSKR